MAGPLGRHNDRRRCTATAKTGKQCHNLAVASGLCKAHGGKHPDVVWLPGRPRP